MNEAPERPAWTAPMLPRTSKTRAAATTDRVRATRVASIARIHQDTAAIARVHYEADERRVATCSAEPRTTRVMPGPIFSLASGL